MDTSLRYGGESRALRIATNKNPPTVKYAGDVSALKIHAKQKLQIDSNTLLQVANSHHLFQTISFAYRYWQQF